MQLPASTHCKLAQVSTHAAGAADDRRLGRSRAVSVVHCSAHTGEGHDHARGFDVPLRQGPSSLQVLLGASHAVCMFPVPGMCQVLGVCCLCISIWALTCAKHRCARLHRHTTGPRCRQLVMHGAPGCRQMPLGGLQLRLAAQLGSQVPSQACRGRAACSAYVLKQACQAGPACAVVQGEVHPRRP